MHYFLKVLNYLKSDCWLLASYFLNHKIGHIIPLKKISFATFNDFCRFFDYFNTPKKKCQPLR